ncbi:vacuolar cation/proton exchanger 3-like isoform X3 [Alnus glutinosa]|uniref:vacuolar cation/proton exchanger 3-like isoform X3 n=1 Tax=Alnus glutinosa TaxID=3517 RepID=UPI002D77274C|nr:vacuolar cation/proton exchanger 3-like isoform X3 [Alnus glutinosa]
MDMENNGDSKGLIMEKELSNGRTPQNVSSSILRKKSDPILVSKIRFKMVRQLLANLQEVLLGTKLAVLFPAVPLAIVADFYNFGRPWIFALSLLGLAPLAERVSFLTEQIAYYTGATVGGLLNATCGNATELIIALFALRQNKIHVVKYSLLGSILSNLLLVLGTSLLCGGLANLKKEQRYDRDDDEEEDEEKAVLGFGSAFTWLVGMTIIISVLSEYVVGTIEAASESWGISVSFISIILLPIVGNAAEHAGSIIFAFKNKLDISLGVALGSASQISMFVVPLSVIVAWIMGIQMDLDFSLLETGSLAFSIIVTAFALQDGTSHYMKGVVLFLCYIVISACFFVHKIPPPNQTAVNLGVELSSGGLTA